jgi:hypothetical protein
MPALACASLRFLPLRALPGAASSSVSAEALPPGGAAALKSRSQTVGEPSPVPPSRKPAAHCSLRPSAIRPLPPEIRSTSPVPRKPLDWSSPSRLATRCVSASRSPEVAHPVEVGMCFSTSRQMAESPRWRQGVHGKMRSQRILRRRHSEHDWTARLADFAFDRDDSAPWPPPVWLVPCEDAAEPGREGGSWPPWPWPPPPTDWIGVGGTSSSLMTEPSRG